MDETGQPGSHKSSSSFANDLKQKRRTRPFTRFRETVDRELERTILDRMKSFRDEMVKLRERK